MKFGVFIVMEELALKRLFLIPLRFGILLKEHNVETNIAPWR